MKRKGFGQFIRNRRRHLVIIILAAALVLAGIVFVRGKIAEKKDDKKAYPVILDENSILLKAKDSKAKSFKKTVSALSDDESLNVYDAGDMISDGHTPAELLELTKLSEEQSDALYVLVYETGNSIKKDMESDRKAKDIGKQEISIAQFAAAVKSLSSDELITDGPEIELLCGLTDSLYREKQRSPEEMADLFDADAALMQEYYELYVTTLGISGGVALPADLFEFIKSDLYSDSDYTATFGTDKKNEIERLSVFCDENEVSRLMTPAEIAACLGISEDDAGLLAVYVKSADASYEPGELTLSELLDFINNKIRKDERFSGFFDDDMNRQLDTLEKAVSLLGGRKKYAYSDIASFGVDMSLVKLVYTYHAYYYGTETMELRLSDALTAVADNIDTFEDFLGDKSELVLRAKTLCDATAAGCKLTSSDLVYILGIQDTVADSICNDYLKKYDEDYGLTMSISQFCYFRKTYNIDVYIRRDITVLIPFGDEVYDRIDFADDVMSMALAGEKTNIAGYSSVLAHSTCGDKEFVALVFAYANLKSDAEADDYSASIENIRKYLKGVENRNFYALCGDGLKDEIAAVSGRLDEVSGIFGDGEACAALIVTPEMSVKKAGSIYTSAKKKLGKDFTFEGENARLYLKELAAKKSKNRCKAILIIGIILALAVEIFSFVAHLREKRAQKGHILTKNHKK